jgi:hypothetical protein
MTTVPVVFFNANPLAVTVAVNGATAPFGINGTSSSISWRPQSPFSNPVTFSASGPPAANVLVPGSNSIAITPKGVTNPYTFTVYLPPTFQWNSIELYIYFNSYATVSWIVLNDGQFVAGTLENGLVFASDE